MTYVLVTVFKACTKIHLKNDHIKQICYEICGLLVQSKHCFWNRKPKISNKNKYLHFNQQIWQAIIMKYCSVTVALMLCYFGHLINWQLHCLFSAESLFNQKGRSSAGIWQRKRNSPEDRWEVSSSFELLTTTLLSFKTRVLFFRVPPTYTSLAVLFQGACHTCWLRGQDHWCQTEGK